MYSRYITILLLLIGIFIAQFTAAQLVSTDHIESVKVAGIILKWIPKEKEENYKRAETLIREAASKGVKIVCTAESFLDGYSIRDKSLTNNEFRQLAEPIPGGKFVTKLQKLSAELNIYLIAGLTERAGDKVYNSAVLFGPDGEISGKYRKKYLWIDEEDKYSAGITFPVFDTQYGKVGMMICADRHEKEAIIEMKSKGVEIVFCPAGGGYGAENDKVVCQRSKEGNIPIVFVHPIEFLVAGPGGEVLAQNLFGETLDENSNKTYGGMVHLFEIDFKK